jgi:hypothetical protein
MSFDLIGPLSNLNAQLTRQRELEEERRREDTYRAEQARRSEEARQTDLYQNFQQAIASGSIQDKNTFRMLASGQGLESSRAFALEKFISDVSKQRKLEEQKASVAQTAPSLLETGSEIARIPLDQRTTDQEREQNRLSMLLRDTGRDDLALAIAQRGQLNRLAAEATDTTGLRDLVMRQRGLDFAVRQAREIQDIQNQGALSTSLTSPGQLDRVYETLTPQYLNDYTNIQSDFASRYAAGDSPGSLANLRNQWLDKMKARKIGALDDQIRKRAYAQTGDSIAAIRLAETIKDRAISGFLAPVIENQGVKIGASILMQEYAGNIGPEMAKIASRNLEKEKTLGSVGFDPVSGKAIKLGGSPGERETRLVALGEQAHLLGEIYAVSNAIRTIPHSRFQKELTAFKEWARQQSGSSEPDLIALSELNLDPLFTALAVSVQKGIMGEVYSFARSTFTDRILDYVTQLYPSTGTIGYGGKIDFFDVRMGAITRGAMQKTFGGVPERERRVMKYEESWLAEFQNIVNEEHTRLGLPGETPDVTLGIEGRVPKGRSARPLRDVREPGQRFPEKFDASSEMDRIMQRIQ